MMKSSTDSDLAEIFAIMRKASERVEGDEVKRHDELIVEFTD